MTEKVSGHVRGRATKYRRPPTDPDRQDVRTVKHTHPEQAGAGRPQATMTNEARALKTPSLATLKRQAMTEADQHDSKATKAAAKVVKTATGVDRATATLARAEVAQAKAKTVKAQKKAQARVDRATFRLSLATDRHHEAKATLAGCENRRDDLRAYWAGRHPVATQKYRDGAPVHLDLAAFKYRPRPTSGHEAGTAPYAGRSTNLGDKGRATVQYLRSHPGKVSEHNLSRGLTSIGETRDLTHTIQGRVKGRDRTFRQATRAHPVRQAERTSQALRAGGQSPYLWWSLGEAHRATLTRPTGSKFRPLSRSEYDTQYGYPRNQAQAIRTVEALMGRATTDTHPGEGYTLTAPEYSQAQLQAIRSTLAEGPYCIYLGAGDVCDSDLNRWGQCEDLRRADGCACGLTHEGPVKGATEAGYVYQARPREVYEMARLEGELLALTGTTWYLVSVGDAQRATARLRAVLGVTDKATPAGLKYREDKAADLTVQAMTDPTPEACDKASEAHEAAEEYADELKADLRAARAMDRHNAGKARRAMRKADKARPSGGAVLGMVGPSDMPPATPSPPPLREAGLGWTVTTNADPEDTLATDLATDRADRWAQWWTDHTHPEAPTE